jgi:hypothetical protein
MKALSLYALTALITGLHNFYELMSIVNGAPVNLLNCVGLLGSAMLVGGAMLAPVQPRAAVKLALAGSLLCWVFYAPLIVVSLLMPFSTRLEIRSLISSRDYVPLVGVFFGPVLLAASTTISMLSVRHHRESHGTSPLNPRTLQ